MKCIHIIVMLFYIHDCVYLHMHIPKQLYLIVVTWARVFRRDTQNHHDPFGVVTCKGATV